MQDKRLFSSNPETGITEWFTYDEDTDRVFMTSEQDVTGIMDDNDREATAIFQNSVKWGEWARVATIPMSIYAQWLIEKRDRDPEYIKRWINDRDNRKFRTRLGRV